MAMVQFQNKSEEVFKLLNNPFTILNILFSVQMQKVASKNNFEQIICQFFKRAWIWAAYVRLFKIIINTWFSIIPCTCITAAKYWQSYIILTCYQIMIISTCLGWYTCVCLTFDAKRLVYGSQPRLINRILLCSVTSYNVRIMNTYCWKRAELHYQLSIMKWRIDERLPAFQPVHQSGSHFRRPSAPLQG